MAGASLVYSNARVKSMENTFLSQDKITRICYSKDLDEAVHIVYESNYAGGMILDNPYSYEVVLGEEYRLIAEFLREAMPDNSGLTTLLTINDYHNTKALFKAKCLNRKDAEYMLMPRGNINIDIIRSAIEDKNYNRLPEFMAKALAELGTAADILPSPAIIDTVLDKAMYSDVMSVIVKVKSKELKKYWTATIDLTNIATLFRIKQKVGGAKLLQQSFIEGGTLTLDSLVKLADVSYDTIAEKLKFTDYGKIVAAGALEYKSRASLVGYERDWDNYLVNIFRSGRNDLFTIAPIAGFYVAKKIELKSLRMMLICIKNGVNTQDIKQRLRDIYA